MNGPWGWAGPRRTGRIGLVAASVLALSSCMQLASTASDGTRGDKHAQHPSISADGRYVAFDSQASNLAPGDVPGADVFVKDFATGETTMIRASFGAPGILDGPYPVISGDGRHVVFNATAALVPEDTNGTNPDVYIKDLDSGTLRMVNTSSSGEQAVGVTIAASAVSRDGRVVAFWSVAENLVPGLANGEADVFVKDLSTGETTVASTDCRGAATNGALNAAAPAISGDGRYVVFNSDASTLVPGDTNGTSDVF